jgi:hypothetical protein
MQQFYNVGCVYERGPIPFRAGGRSMAEEALGRNTPGMSFFFSPFSAFSDCSLPSLSGLCSLPFFAPLSLARLRRSGLTVALFHCRTFCRDCCAARAFAVVLEYGESNVRELSFGEPVPDGAAGVAGVADRGRACASNDRRALE